MTQKPYITCRQLIDFLGEYVTDELPTTEKAEFERHLSVCPSCVRYIQNYRDTIRLGKQALAPSDAPPDPTVPDSLVRAIMAARSRRL